MKKLAATIFFDAFALTLLGLIIVMSASSTYSFFKFDDIFHLFNSHVFKVLIGIGLMILFCFIPYDLYKEYSKQAMIIITMILFLTLFFAPEIKGAGRRIELGPLSFQPSDAARLILMMHLAALMVAKKDLIGNFKHGFLYLFFWVFVTAVLILVQPNVSNAVLIVAVSLTMMYVGGAKFGHIASTTFFSLLTGGAAAMIFPHSRSRILTFIDSFSNGGDINLQVKQALYGLGSGGIFGVGMGHSRQSNLFLPEAYGDFIFAIFGEELGFAGSVFLMLCFVIFFIAGVLIAKKTKDPFGQLLAFGITFSITLYAFVNIAVATGFFPTTGLPLPFISYGGTSLIFLCISVGILVNIALANNVNADKTVKENPAGAKA
jgi:cell division protein FtsW